jgi:hypothetical protein
MRTRRNNKFPSAEDVGRAIMNEVVATDGFFVSLGSTAPWPARATDTRAVNPQAVNEPGFKVFTANRRSVFRIILVGSSKCHELLYSRPPRRTAGQREGQGVHEQQRVSRSATVVQRSPSVRRLLKFR